MSLKIGVSGVRGIIGESLTQEVISNFAKAFGTLILRDRFIGIPTQKRKPVPIVLIGRDTRQSGEFVRTVVIGGLLSTGCHITDLGLAPTPSVLFLARTLKCNGAIIITASHNPGQWNGLKFVRPDGTFLTKKEIERLIGIYNSKRFILSSNKRSDVGATRRVAPTSRLHLDAVIKAVDATTIRKARFTVAVDYCNGTGAVTTPYLLKKLGCEVVAINAEPNGKFSHNPEPIAKNLEQLCGFVKKAKADVGFAQDPDADRLVVVSEKGIAIGEENTLALVVKHVLTERGQKPFCKNKNVPDPFLKVVVNLSTSRMIDDIAKEFGVQVYRSAVGETNVVDKMRKTGALIGGEGNGGVIYPAVNFGRDSFVGMAIILEYMAKSGKTVSQLVGEIKQYYIEKTKIDCSQEKIKGILENIKNVGATLAVTQRAGVSPAPTSINTLDGIKIDYSDGWVHVRGSNTEPVIRIMAEAETKEQAKRHIDNIKELISLL